jgi:hypothetical protein
MNGVLRVVFVLKIRTDIDIYLCYIKILIFFLTERCVEYIVKTSLLTLFMKNVAVNVSFMRNTRTVREKCVDFLVKPEDQNEKYRGILLKFISLKGYKNIFFFITKSYLYVCQ